MKREEVIGAARAFRANDMKNENPRKKRKVKADKSKGNKWFAEREKLTSAIFKLWHLNRGIVHKMAEMDQCWYVNRKWFVIPYLVEHATRGAVFLRVKMGKQTLFDLSKSAYDEFLEEAENGKIEQIETSEIKNLLSQ